MKEKWCLLDRGELAQMRSLPLELKILKSKQRIQEFCDYYNYNVYVSFSGGKDSTVLYDLVKQVHPTCPAIFCNTGLEYPEIVDFCKNTRGVRFIKPKIPFTKVIEKYGYPVISKEQADFIDQYKRAKSEKTKQLRLNGNKSGMGKIHEKWKYLIDAPFDISGECCNIMKKRPFHIFEHRTGRHPFVGIMASESKLREQSYLEKGCNVYNVERPQSTPLGFWTEQDILEYLYTYKISYCSVYGDIVCDNGFYRTTELSRTGCMFCMFGVHLENEPNRFQRMKVSHPTIYNYCMNRLGIKEVLEYINVKYE